MVAIDPSAPFAAAIRRTLPQRARAVIATTLAWLDEHPVPETAPEEGWGHCWSLSSETTRSRATSARSSLSGELDGIVDQAETLGRYLGQIQPLGADLGSARSDGVRFMSMASAKGLTVEAAIVAAVEDGLTPRGRRPQSPAEAAPVLRLVAPSVGRPRAQGGRMSVNAGRRRLS